MGGGLMQLVAYGAQDIYLTGNPQITFFKVVYRRHTNFSMETIQQTISGSSQVSTGDTSGTVIISRNGDLLSKVYVRCPQSMSHHVAGDKLIKDVELEIGGQKIDKHYQEWLQVWAELSTSSSKAEGYKYLTGGFSNTIRSISQTGQNCIMVPLQFWFCRNPGLALPLIALQYHEVKLKFTWAGSNLGTGPSRDDETSISPSCEVWADYIYLDTDERRRFAQVSHEYLIEQLQKQSFSDATPTSFKLNFNHPVKELIWTNSSLKITNQKAKLQLNGHDRFAAQDKEYFQIRQPYEYHTSIPFYNIKEVETVYKSMHGTNAVTVSDSLINAVAPATNPSSVDDTARYAIDLTAETETLTGGAAVSALDRAHLAFYSTTDPGIKQGDVLTLIEYDTGAGEGSIHLTTNTVGDVIYSTGSSTSHDMTGTIENRCAVRFTTDLFSPFQASTLDVGNLIITRSSGFIYSSSKCSQLDRDINVYSFALKPEEHQPSGTCNFSRIDNAKLHFSAALHTVPGGGDKTDGTDVLNETVNIYAVNYNVLRIMSGMGGLAYSN